jgi:hypothetical protein
MFRSALWRISRLSWVLPVLLFWIIARTFLAASLGWLDVDVTQWNEVQLETVLLHVVVPDAVVPETAVIDFLVAISVLPMATFTTMSVLGGTHDMPNWMKGQGSGLENLQMDLLEAPDEDEEIEAPPIYDATVPEEPEVEEVEEEEEESRMIDLPFRLFDD